MKTLILKGSPRKAGDTAALLQALQLPGEVAEIDCFEAKISPCVDCRYCRSHEGCCIRDEMQAVYKRIEESDCILIASPIWFGTLPGPLLSVASRLQCYFSAGFFRKAPKLGGKKGAVILVGGGSGGAESAYATAAMLLRQMGTEGEIPLAASLHTDSVAAAADPKVQAELKKIAEYFD